MNKSSTQQEQIEWIKVLFGGKKVSKELYSKYQKAYNEAMKPLFDYGKKQKQS